MDGGIQEFASWVLSHLFLISCRGTGLPKKTPGLTKRPIKKVFRGAKAVQRANCHIKQNRHYKCRFPCVHTSYLHGRTYKVICRWCFAPPKLFLRAEAFIWFEAAILLSICNDRKPREIRQNKIGGAGGEYYVLCGCVGWRQIVRRITKIILCLLAKSNGYFITDNHVILSILRRRLKDNRINYYFLP